MYIPSPTPTHSQSKGHGSGTWKISASWRATYHGYITCRRTSHHCLDWSRIPFYIYMYKHKLLVILICINILKHISYIDMYNDIYIHIYIYTRFCTHTHMHVVYSLIDRADVRIRSTGAFCPGSREIARIGERQKVVNPWEVPPPAQHLGR